MFKVKNAFFLHYKTSEAVKQNFLLKNYISVQKFYEYLIKKVFNLPIIYILLPKSRNKILTPTGICYEREGLVDMIPLAKSSINGVTQASNSFEENFVSHSEGPTEQFGMNLKGPRSAG